MTPVSRCPDVKAVNGIPEERVFDALNRTKDFLIAANLDQAVLHGGWPTKALKMLDAQDSARAGLIRHLRKPGAQGGDPTEMFTRFDPAELRVVDDGIRVHGRMAFEAGSEPGQLRVRADYTFVYALGRADSVAPSRGRGKARRRWRAQSCGGNWSWTSTSERHPESWFRSSTGDCSVTMTAARRTASSTRTSPGRRRGRTGRGLSPTRTTPARTSPTTGMHRALADLIEQLLGPGRGQGGPALRGTGWCAGPVQCGMPSMSSRAPWRRRATATDVPSVAGSRRPAHSWALRIDLAVRA